MDYRFEALFHGKNIVIFGTGSAARRLMETTGVVPNYLVDNDRGKWGTVHFGNLEVHSPDRLLTEQRERLLILIASSFFDEIGKQLQQMGFREFVHYLNGLQLMDSPYAELSYSQEGEDMLLRDLFSNRGTGFYVDVGAHHPIRFSNTYRFYLRGWRGINIDPAPGMKELFDRCRPRDINLEAGVSSEDHRKLELFVFNDSALNTFNRDLAMKRSSGKYRIIDTIAVPVWRLDTIFRQQSVAESIDFLSIDVEGNEMDVLASNDWEQYRPKYVLVEDLGRMFDQLSKSPVSRFMQDIRYELVARTTRTSVFAEK